MPVTEIRPRRATELVDASFQLLRRFYAPLVTVSAVAKFPDILARIILRNSMRGPAVLVGRNSGAWILVSLIALASIMIADTMLVVAVSDGYLKGEIDLTRVFRAGARGVVTVTFATFLRVLMVFGICIVCSVPFAILVMAHVPFAPLLLALLAVLFATYPLIRTFATTSIVMLEGEGANTAVGRSFRLTKEFVPHIFYSLGLAFVLTFIFTGISTALTLKLLTPAMAGLVQALIVIPIYPFVAVVATLLYYDLRIRKEGFDLEVILREMPTDVVGARLASSNA